LTHPLTPSTPLFRSRFINKRRPTPFWFRLAHAEKKVSQQFRSPLGVLHFRVEFHCVDLPLGVFDGSDGILGPAHGPKTCGQRPHVISVAIPYAQPCWYTGKQRRVLRPALANHLKLRTPIFAALRLLDFAAERVRDPLHSDRKSTRLNSSHQIISYAVFCLKKKNLYNVSIYF